MLDPGISLLDEVLDNWLVFDVVLADPARGRRAFATAAAFLASACSLSCFIDSGVLTVVRTCESVGMPVVGVRGTGRLRRLDRVELVLDELPRLDCESDRTITLTLGLALGRA